MLPYFLLGARRDLGELCLDNCVEWMPSSFVQIVEIFGLGSRFGGGGTGGDAATSIDMESDG